MVSIYLYFLPILAIYLFTKHYLVKIQNLPPSPFPTLPIVGHLYLFKKPLHRTLSAISGRYGPVLFLRFGSRPVLLVSSPSATEECFTKNDIVFANRPRLLTGKHLGQNYTTIPWAPYGDHWRNLRRISSIEIFSSHRLLMLSGMRAEEVRSLLRRLFRNPGDQAVNMKTTFFELMHNLMMRMIAGKRYYGENLAGVEEVRWFREIVAETFRIGGASNIMDFLPVLRWLGVGGLEKKLMALKAERDQFMQELIEEHRRRRRMGEDSNPDEPVEANNKAKTMVEALLSLQDSDPNYYTDEMIRGLMTVRDLRRSTIFMATNFDGN